MEKIIKIDGMSCNHCVMRVTKSLKDVEGVEDVTVSLAEKEARFITDHATADDVLIKAVEDCGYNVLKII